MKTFFRSLINIWKDMDKPLFICSLILFLFGTINIVTSSSSDVINNNMSLYHYFFKQMQILIMGLIAAYFVLKIPTKKWKGLAATAYIIVASMLLYLVVNGVAHRGALNWLDIFGIRVQPSEFMKPVMIVCLAIAFEMFYYRLRDKNIKHINMIGIIIGIAAIPISIVFLQKDLGSMAIILGIFVVMFIFSPVLIKEKQQAFMVLVILVLLGVVVQFSTRGYVLTDAQISRFNDYWKPCANYEHGGYQVCNGIIAINNGGLFGLGVGKSQQKYSYIPEAHTDSVFAIIVEEYGLIFVSFIFIAYIFIIKRILDISSNATSIRNRHMAFGVAVYIFIHIFINLGGLLAVIPLTGVPLPFLSYGGSFALSLIISLAIVERVHIETKREKIKIK